MDYRCPAGRQLRGIYRDCRDRGPNVTARCRCTECKGAVVDAVRFAATGKVRACPDCYARYKVSLESLGSSEGRDR